MQMQAGMMAASAFAPQMREMMTGFTGTSAPVSEASNTIKCPICGTELPAKAKFCHNCGSKIEALNTNEIICPHCGKKTIKGKFCLECGQLLASVCPKCGAELPPNAKFCLECGEKIGV